MSDMTAKDLAAKYPNAAEELRAESRAQGFEAGKAEGRNEGHKQGFEEGQKAGAETGKAEGLLEGAAAERQRIVDLEAAALPGFEAQLKACKEDGKSTAADLATQIVAAQKGQGQAYLDKLKADKDALAKAGGIPDPTTGSTGATKPKQDARALAAKARELIEAEAKEGRSLAPDEAIRRIVDGQAA